MTHRLVGAAATHRRLARQLAAQVIRRNGRTVMLTPHPGPRLGNYLYFWLHAHAEQRRGVDYVVEAPDYMTSWLDVFPGLRRLTVAGADLRLRDRREWPNEWMYQRFAVDFDRTDLEGFVRAMLLCAPLLREPGPGGRPGTVVINVRRGDYYSKPDFRALYGFDVKAYLGEALRRCESRAPVDEVIVVSDDPQWCRANLDGLARKVTRDVLYSDPSDTPEANLRLIAGARRLIGTNSTFSYWGGYLSGVRYGGASHVVMPWLHSRGLNGGSAYQLDGRWDVVTALPSGWQVPEAD